ncbi:retrotransposon protein, putative, ty1-copia subclass [Tanacetum coccineum]
MNLKRTRNFIENEIDKDIMSSENGVNTPAPNPSPNSSFSLLSVLGRERLTGPNYMDWMRNLRFTLRYENKEYVLDEQIPIIDNDSTQEEIEAHQKHYDDANKVSYIMTAKASKERLDVVKSLMACKPKPGASICAFVLEMKGYFDRLESLNMAFDVEFSINMILSAAHVLTVGHNAKKRKTSHSNWKGKAAESKIAPTSDPKEAVCFYCNTKGHWKRSCPKYLKDLKDGKVKKGSHSGMFMIELHNTTTSDSWVLDTGCGTHICTVLQGLKESRRLKHGELNLVMGNRKITPVTRIGKYELMLKSGVRIDLNNCCYSSEMTKNIFFHFMLCYKFSFDNENEDILVYSNGCFMFKASPCKGIYETVECISHNGNVILNVGSSNELDKSKLWHSRLGHINKKRIAQLQKDGVLESFDFKSDDVCESCLLGKMTKSPLIGSCERGKGLLDLVYTDVCGPFDQSAKMENAPTIKRPKDNVVFVARRGTFLEREMISKEDSGSKIDLEEIQETSSRVSKPSQDPQFYYGFHIEEDKISDSTLIDLNEPANYKEAMACPEAAKWKEAMKSEIQSMYDNQVWNLVDTTPGLKIVGCKWIFKKKTDMDGKVHTYKARLVAKGYTQTHGIDYEETFSPVAKIKSIRIMLAIAAFHDYEIWQMDVKTAFLNGKLTEDVFMAQPEGFENAKYPKRVCKLQKAIYGLKQASRSWNLCFHEKVTQFGFSRSEDESCIYIKVSGSVVVFLVLYVDDILLIGNDIPTLQSVKEWLGKCFAMKDLGDAVYVLGIKIYIDRTKRLIGLSQDTYLDKILKRFKMENSKKGNLPLHHGIKISRSIMYTMTCTRPDVSFALSMVSRHQQNPGDGHWTAVKNILKYLRNTISDELVRLQGSYLGEEFHWRSWRLVSKLVQDTIEIFCDNESAVALTKEPKDHGKSKHIDRKYHFVQSKVKHEGHCD